MRIIGRLSFREKRGLNLTLSGAVRVVDGLDEPFS